MRTTEFLRGSFYILLMGLVLNLASCGGSNVNNPVSAVETTEEKAKTNDDVVELAENKDASEPTQSTDLDIKITVTKKTMEPGTEAELTASVKGVRGTSVSLNWLNITKHGKLSNANENVVVWTAPDSLNGLNVQVEVIQLVVTVISEVVSVESDGIDTDTQIFSETKTVLLTVKNKIGE